MLLYAIGSEMMFAGGASPNHHSGIVTAMIPQKLFGSTHENAKLLLKTRYGSVAVFVALAKVKITPQCLEESEDCNPRRAGILLTVSRDPPSMLPECSEAMLRTIVLRESLRSR